MFLPLRHCVCAEMSVFRLICSTISEGGLCVVCTNVTNKTCVNEYANFCVILTASPHRYRDPLALFYVQLFRWTTGFNVSFSNTQSLYLLLFLCFMCIRDTMFFTRGHHCSGPMAGNEFKIKVFWWRQLFDLMLEELLSITTLKSPGRTD